MPRILVVEDDDTYRESLVFNLRRDGFEVGEAADGITGLEIAQSQSWDLLLLDVMLPGLSGTEICRQIRQTQDVAIIMVTAKDDVIDKIVGLEIGADDYVTKPYSYRELLARINAVLRRRVVPNLNARSDEDIVNVGDLTVWVDRHEVEVAGEPITMPLREFELLVYLAENAGRVLTRTQLIDRIWGPGFFGDSKTLDVHVKRLRSRIEADPSRPSRILTVRGLGYKLVAPTATE